MSQGFYFIHAARHYHVLITENQILCCVTKCMDNCEKQVGFILYFHIDFKNCTSMSYKIAQGP